MLAKGKTLKVLAATYKWEPVVYIPEGSLAKASVTRPVRVILDHMLQFGNPDKVGNPTTLVLVLRTRPVSRQDPPAPRPPAALLRFGLENFLR